MAEKQQESARRQTGLASREPSRPIGRSRQFGQLATEMDRLFDVFGLGRGWIAPRFGSDWSGGRSEQWYPELEVFERNHELVIRADLPGLRRDDVKVEVTDSAVTIEGERKEEHQEEREGVWRSERSYGSFRRMVALPEGAIADQAKATFKDGVLEITMPTPPESVKQGRRIEITQAT